MEDNLHITWAARFTGEPVAYVANNFVFLGSEAICRLQKLSLSDEALVAPQITVSLSDLV